jgi:hypothetical protein
MIMTTVRTAKNATCPHVAIVPVLTQTMAIMPMLITRWLECTIRSIRAAPTSGHVGLRVSFQCLRTWMRQTSPVNAKAAVRMRDQGNEIIPEYYTL